MDSLISNTAAINGLLARFGVKFGIYKNGEFHEQLFPYDSLPRIIPADEFAEIEAGLIQRVDALNAFLRDIYTEKRIVADGVIPEDFAFSSSGFRVTTLFRRTEFTLIFQALTSSKLKTELGTFLKTTYAFLQALPIL